MKRIELQAPRGVTATAVSIGAGALEEAGRAAAAFPTVLLVTDENVGVTPWFARIEAACLEDGGPEPIRFMLPVGEETKSLEFAEGLCRQWLQTGAGRDAVVLAVGGGVVTDLAGFSASVFLRGVSWIAVPTTVLGMADASIGGKTGVNLDEGKNLVGSFWHPVSVHADPETLTTLGDGFYSEGWAEVIKAGVIADLALFEKLESEAEAVRARDAELLPELLAASIDVKGSIVRADAREAGPREILNFGHTLAHALETASGHQISHGEAVAIGMVGEAKLGAQLGRFGEDVPKRIACCCAALNLPTTLPGGLEDRTLSAALSLDKKRRSGRLRIALPTALGAHDPAEPCVELEASFLLAAARG